MENISFETFREYCKYGYETLIDPEVSRYELMLACGAYKETKHCEEKNCPILMMMKAKGENK